MLLEYFFYILFSILILDSYVRLAMERKELNVTYHILAGVGLIFALGVIVSLWTGPIYPHLAKPYERFWAGLDHSTGGWFYGGDQRRRRHLDYYLCLLLVHISSLSATCLVVRYSGYSGFIGNYLA